jgi:hypothetical protein
MTCKENKCRFYTESNYHGGKLQLCQATQEQWVCKAEDKDCNLERQIDHFGFQLSLMKLELGKLKEINSE